MVLRSAIKLTVVFAPLTFFMTIMPAAGAGRENIPFLAWSPDGTLLAMANGTTVRIVDAVTLEALNTLTGLRDQYTAPSWSPDGNQLAIANVSEVQIWYQPWNPDAVQLTATLPTSLKMIWALAWNPKRNRIVVAGSILEMWDVSTSTPWMIYRQEDENGMRITQVDWNTTGTLLATTDFYHKVRIWDAATGHILSTMSVVTSDTSMPPGEVYSNPLCVS